MIHQIFTSSGTEELRSVSGLVAHVVCPATVCLADYLKSGSTVFNISLDHLPPLIPPLLNKRVELRW